MVEARQALLREGEACAPTVFPGAERADGEQVARVESILGDNFVGTYLVGVARALEAGDLQSRLRTS